MKSHKFHELSGFKQTETHYILFCRCPGSLYRPDLFAIGRSSGKERNYALKKVCEKQGVVSYQVEIRIEDLQERTLFFVGNNEGKTRAWQPGSELSRNALRPDCFYFSNRYLYLVFDASHALISIDDVKNDFFALNCVKSRSSGAIRISGVLFRDIRNTKPFPHSFKLTKYRDDAHSYSGDMKVFASNRTTVYGRTLRNYKEFNGLSVLEFGCDIVIDDSLRAGCYFVHIGDDQHRYLLKDYHAPTKSKSSNEKTIYTQISKQTFIKCTFYFDAFAKTWKVELINQGRLENAIERSLNKLRYFGRRGRKLSNRWPTRIAFIGEYPHTARDNGAALYNYIRRYHPDLNVYYIIEKDATQIENLADKSKLIYYGSLKHQLYSFAVKYLIFTHFPENLLPKSRHTMDIFNIENRYRTCFIQHGVIATTPAVNIYDFNRRNFDLFFVSSQREKILVKDYLNYPEKRVLISGLARWDNLLTSNAEKQGTLKSTVFVMPTWRNDLVSVDQRTYHASHYYQTWLSFFQHPRLKALSKKQNLEFVFVPHIIVSHFDHEFANGKNIVIADISKIQSLLIKAKLFITDFSSVAFDMVYMNKPVIFYPFDQHNMEKLRNGPGYINFTDELPGDVVFETDDLLNKLTWYADNSFEVPKKFQSRAKRFVGERMKNHSKRIVGAVFDM